MPWKQFTTQSINVLDIMCIKELQKGYDSWGYDFFDKKAALCKKTGLII